MKITDILRRHDFNSQWLGYEVGIIQDMKFFSFSDQEIKQALSRYQWVELRTVLEDKKKIHRMNQLGFNQIDTQIRFSLDLTQIKNNAETVKLNVNQGNDFGFNLTVENIASFKNERFFAIPGVTQRMIDDRYVTIARTLMRDHSTHCLCVSYENKIQGWYFATPSADKLNLSLAMLHKNAEIQGKHLYRKALALYGQTHHIATERFSINNVAVHNILASLGAHFLEPELVWLWHSEL